MTNYIKEIKQREGEEVGYIKFFSKQSTVTRKQQEMKIKKQIE